MQKHLYELIRPMVRKLVRGDQVPQCGINTTTHNQIISHYLSLFTTTAPEDPTMTTSPLEQLLSSYLYSCQQILPAQNYQPSTQYTSPALIQPTITYPSTPSYPQLTLPPTIPPPPYCSTYPSPQSDQSTEPVPSVVIHHKPSSYPPPPPETFYWRDQTEYRTKLMDTAISKAELLDLLAYYPLNPPSSGKTRRTTSSSSSTSEKPYTRPRPSPITNSRTTFTPSQLEFLEVRFRQSPKIDKDERLELSLEIGVSETAIRTWFQNRRARQRRTETLKRQAQQAAETGTVDENSIPVL